MQPNDETAAIGMYEITVRDSFSAAHHINGYPGECSRQHGHNWEVEVCLRCRELDERGLSIDFRVAREALKGVLVELDHQDLNTLAPFREQNPTSESLARHIFFQIARRVPEAVVTKVTVHESPSSSVSYWE
jgi:6-pyruvoyltetrahydropterin/6-carboxytetrahydropterin synthase